jgi:hypothetical protein
MRKTSFQKKKAEKGQAIVLIAITFVVLLVFVGLTVDVGQVYIQYGHLRRGVDAAALAAAAQYREGRGLDDMAAAAAQVLNINGIDPNTLAMQIQTCETNPGDSELCFDPPRKMVRVVAHLDTPTTFLMLIGIRTAPLTANAIGEAASLDVVLVIDISESMTDDSNRCDGDNDDAPDDLVADDGRTDDWGCGPAIPPTGTNNLWDDYWRDPHRCNAAHRCHPFEEVKAAAISFVDRVLNRPAADEADRIAIVTFSNGWQNGATEIEGGGWIWDHATAVNVVENLTVYDPPLFPVTLGSGRLYDTGEPSGNYLGFECTWDDVFGPAVCPTTNIGGGLLLGGNMFALETREEALWVVVLLTDGAANSSDPDPASGHPYGFCPPDTWFPPFCRDRDSDSRHSTGDPDYDADDYARDMADFVGCYPVEPAAGCNGVAGQGAVVFAIGLGDQVLRTYSPDPDPHGAKLLRYVAAVGDDGDPNSDPCVGRAWNEWCGNYYFSPTGNELDLVFEDIASRIFTRIAH